MGGVFDIQRFCVHDGPGIRTTVFLKGCPLRCKWCHNPEALLPGQQLEFLPAKCVGCGACFDACPRGCHSMAGDEHVIARETCDYCGKCVQNCYAQALQFSLRYMSAQEALDVVLRDKAFYKSGGGMTVSGGEPLAQSDFTCELLALAKKNGLHTAVDTSGFAPYSSIARTLPHTDLYLYDLKCMDPDAHLRATGVALAPILENLKRLCADGGKVWIRVPVIEPFNDSEENMRAAARFLADLPGIERVELLPYHKLGGGKYESLGMEYAGLEYRAPSGERMKRFADIFGEYGIRSLAR